MSFRDTTLPAALTPLSVLAARCHPTYKGRAILNVCGEAKTILSLTWLTILKQLWTGSQLTRLPHSQCFCRQHPF